MSVVLLRCTLLFALLLIEDMAASQRIAVAQPAGPPFTLLVPPTKSALAHIAQFPFWMPFVAIPLAIDLLIDRLSRNTTGSRVADEAVSDRASGPSNPPPQSVLQTLASMFSAGPPSTLSLQRRGPVSPLAMLFWTFLVAGSLAIVRLYTPPDSEIARSIANMALLIIVAIHIAEILTVLRAHGRARRTQHTDTP